MGDHEVVAVGNAIVDIIGRCDDAFLAAQGCSKGSMRLVDADAISRLYDAMGPAVEISGGSAANTMVGIASLGGRAGFIGKIAGDTFGQVFSHDIRAAGVTFTTSTAAEGSAPTGRCIVLVTPDGQRTMSTFLGVSPELGAGEIDGALIASARILYLEGYLFDRPQAKGAFHDAAALAAKAGRKVALSLSDPFCVDRHRSAFRALARTHVDILLANEAEILSLYQTASFAEAAVEAGRDAELAALTRSEKGSVVIAKGEALTIAPAPVARVVDTTGAGDLFAAGFLYGIATDKGPLTAARLGSLAAGEIIGHIGARPEVSLAELARRSGLIP
jgi:sugar/nucleoside kinase (ribokinase family)